MISASDEPGGSVEIVTARIAGSLVDWSSASTVSILFTPHSFSPPCFSSPYFYAALPRRCPILVQLLSDLDVERLAISETPRA